MGGPPVSGWSSLEPTVNTTTFGSYCAVICLRYSDQLTSTSGRARPVETCPSTVFTGCTTPSVLPARSMSDSPGMIESESPPTQKRSGFSGLNFSLGGSVVVVVTPPGTVTTVVGLGSAVFTSSSSPRPSASFSHWRGRSVWRKWLTDATGSAKNTDTSRRHPSDWPWAVFCTPCAFSSQPTIRRMSPINSTWPAAMGVRRASPPSPNGFGERRRWARVWGSLPDGCSVVGVDMRAGVPQNWK